MFGISNILLEIYNMNQSKKALWVLIAGTLTFLGGLGAFHLMGGEIGHQEWLLVSLVLLVAIIGMVAAQRKMRDESVGLPAEDERSLAIKTRAGSQAFHWSFISWTYVLLFFSESDWPIHRIIAVGLALSIVLYGFFWLRERQKGQ